MSSLELNFLVTKYHEMRDKDGQDVHIYPLSYGLCEAERFPWDYPRGRRDDRSYFVQRCFDYTRTVHQFLAQNQTIRCPNCGACFNMDEREKFEFLQMALPGLFGRCMPSSESWGRVRKRYVNHRFATALAERCPPDLQVERRGEASTDLEARTATHSCGSAAGSSTTA